MEPAAHIILAWVGLGAGLLIIIVVIVAFYLTEE
jgi:hypothetical protein